MNNICDPGIGGPRFSAPPKSKRFDWEVSQVASANCSKVVCFTYIAEIDVHFCVMILQIKFVAANFLVSFRTSCFAFAQHSGDSGALAALAGQLCGVFLNIVFCFCTTLRWFWRPGRPGRLVFLYICQHPFLLSRNIPVFLASWPLWPVSFLLFLNNGACDATILILYE